MRVLPVDSAVTVELVADQLWVDVSVTETLECVADSSILDGLE